MTDESDFVAALDREPDNHLLRMLYADFLDERGDPRGPGYRALGVNERYAHFGDRQDVGPYWIWMTAWEYPQHTLPGDWWAEFYHESRQRERYTANRSECESAIALAFARLPESRRAELLNPASVGASA